MNREQKVLQQKNSNDAIIILFDGTHKIYSEKCFAAEFLNLNRLYYDAFFANVK